MASDEKTDGGASAGGNQRQAVRKDLRVKVTLGQQSQLQQFFSRNLSEGGIFLEMEELIPVGEEVALKFNVPGQNQPLNITAKVVRHHKFRVMGEDFNTIEVKGVGLAFTNISPAEKQSIARFVTGQTVMIES